MDVSNLRPIIGNLSTILISALRRMQYHSRVVELVVVPAVADDIEQALDVFVSILDRSNDSFAMLRTSVSMRMS